MQGREMVTLSLDAALERAGQLERGGGTSEARKIYAAILKGQPGNRKARKRLKALGGPLRAPDGPDRQEIEAILSLCRTGQAGAALARIRAGLERYPNALALWNLQGMACKSAGDLDASETSFRRAIDLAPDKPDAHNNLGVVLKDRLRTQEALECFETAQRLSPEHVDSLNNLGNTLKLLERTGEAREAYRKALALKPGHPEILRNIAVLDESLNDLDGLEQTLANAEALGRRDEPAMLYYAAHLAFRRKDISGSEVLLERLRPEDLPVALQFSYHRLLADISDRKGDVDAAFASYRRMNEAAATASPDALTSAEALMEFGRRDQAHLRRASLPLRRPTTPEEAPVFLVGFPRSGTTLLDTLLWGHSRVTVAEERPMVRRMMEALPGSADAASIEALDADAVEHCRATYFRERALHLPDGSPGVFIDKMPFNLLYAPLIHRVFPAAKFILALRHPMDCVLSCYMQNFHLNPAMANMLEIRRAAGLYDLSMQIFDLCRTRYGLDVHQLRYEDLVEDTRGQMAGLLDFLQLDWEEGVTDNCGTATRRGLINTPSYSQVNQPIYREAKGRWTRYRHHLEEAEDLLAPWAKRFGYAL